MKPNIYISAPVSIDWIEVTKVVDKIKSTDLPIDVTYFERKAKYFPYLLTNCNIFVFMTTDNNWEFNVHTLPSGVKREYDTAVVLGKPIFMAYKIMEGLYNLYEITKDGNRIQGVAGSSSIIWKTVKNISSELLSSNTPSKRDVVIDLETLQKVSRISRPLTPSECIEYDPRLLL